ncbi:MAG: hypothetical protein K2K12_05805 [Clostridia bacterium]|nr:hypothetical protein [Clostridia bacterium]
MDSNERLRNSIKKFIKNSHASYLTDLDINPELQTSLIYPTCDLFLTKQQYDSLWRFLNAIGEDKFYLTQFDNVPSGIDSEENTFLCIDKNTDYHEYMEINLYSLSLLISENGTWAIFIDETLDGGIGIFVASQKYMEAFQLCYPQLSNDLLSYQEDAKGFDEFYSTEYYDKLMKILHIY